MSETHHDRAALAEAIAAGGGISKLSIALGLHRTAVSKWDRVPAAHVVRVAELTGIPAAKLRPDLAAAFSVEPV
jgi:DNA-binding transcriptional regulator YdaS (Cro superfamily)